MSRFNGRRANEKGGGGGGEEEEEEEGRGIKSGSSTTAEWRMVYDEERYKRARYRTRRTYIYPSSR